MSKHRAIASMLLLLSSGALADNFVGQASVIDGDTLEIHGTHIRLWGIDAPESSQLCRDSDSNLYRCGANAANDLDTFIARRPVNCKRVSEDQYGRSVATCSVGGIDLGEWLVRNGLALDWPRYSKGRYAAAERDADRSGRGYGQAATWSHGCSACAPGRAAPRPTARMMQTHILECAFMRRIGASTVKRAKSTSE